MKYHLVSASLLVAAAVLETLGLGGGVLVLFAAGIGCEAWFWVRLVRRLRSSRLARQASHQPLHGEL